MLNTFQSNRPLTDAPSYAPTNDQHETGWQRPTSSAGRQLWVGEPIWLTDRALCPSFGHADGDTGWRQRRERGPGRLRLRPDTGADSSNPLLNEAIKTVAAAIFQG